MTVESFSKETGRKILFQTFDEIGYKAAADYYDEIIEKYYLSVPDNMNIILLDQWDGDIKKLGETYELMKLIVWYERAFARPLHVNVFGMEHEWVVIDGLKNEILMFDYANSDSKVVQLNFKFQDEYFYDYFFDELYAFNKKGTIKVNKIDLAKGDFEQTVELSNILLPRNIKISNGWIYFLVLDESGFNRLLKTH